MNEERKVEKVFKVLKPSKNPSNKEREVGKVFKVLNSWDSSDKWRVVMPIGEKSFQTKKEAVNFSIELNKVFK